MDDEILTTWRFHAICTRGPEQVVKSMTSIPLTSPQESEYAWEVATLYPEQGGWSEEDYLRLTDGTNRLIEFRDGRLEFLPMPTDVHQALVEYLYLALREFVQQGELGVTRFCGLRVRIRPGKIREPDILFLHKDHFHVRHNRVWDGADLVMEVVSGDPKDNNRDYKEKLADYAEASIAEYWIVDPNRLAVLVHQLRDGRYAVHGEFAEGSRATSVLLPDFGIDVTALFAVIADIPD
jgi:Uma2 family endonuclease